MFIKEIATEEQKKVLRKVKLESDIADVARNTLVCGCIEQGAYIQFGSDIKLYGLWSALLSAENYEQQGCYTPGSALKAFKAAVEQL